MPSSDLKLIFAGTPDFSAQHLEALIQTGFKVISVYTQPDRPAGRGKQLTPSPVKLLALQHGIPVYQPVSLRDSVAQQELARQNPDLMVVVAYGLILPKAVLDTPHLGCINVHASLLPRWRGAAPIQRAILAGDKQTGITIMQMDVGLDTGPMLAKCRVPIDAKETANSLQTKLAEAGTLLMLETLSKLASGVVSGEPQNEIEATYAAKIGSKDAAIDWLQSATFIERQIRAFNPVPGAWSSVGTERFKLWSALVLESYSRHRSEEIGVIRQSNSMGIDVLCGEGTLRIQALQLSGKRRMSCEELLQGNSALFQPGTRLSSMIPEHP